MHTFIHSSRTFDGETYVCGCGCDRPRDIVQARWDFEDRYPVMIDALTGRIQVIYDRTAAAWSKLVKDVEKINQEHRNA